jgi:hypothetical protein
MRSSFRAGSPPMSTSVKENLGFPTGPEPPVLADQTTSRQPRPVGVTAIATLFLLSAAYLAGLGAIILAAPGTVSMMLGAPLLFDLTLAGPYMFLVFATVGALIGWGLLRLNNFARRSAAIAAMFGVVLLVPSVSASVITLSVKGLIWGGLAVVIRVIIAWYFWQRPVIEAFEQI